MKRRVVFSLLPVLILLIGCMAAVQNQGDAPVHAGVKSPGGDMPLDPDIVSGTLDNGLKYLVRSNPKPEKRLELRLVVNAGSVLEDDDQQGLAHFLEHMAFNGTEHFEKQELVDYLESIGMRFGPELNAYTSFDETVYMLQVPVDREGAVDTAFQILEDWAQGISFDPEEIDKERGVVIEEWRLGRGADARIRDKQLPVLLKDSKYADRLPIGKLDILEKFDRDTIKRFYRDWYRPELMGVIAVGDMESAELESLVKRHFSRLKAPCSPRERKIYELPDHEGTLYAIATDPEATGNSIAIYFKHDVTPQGSERDYRSSIVRQLYNGMFNARLSELAREADPPFQYAYSTQGRFLKSREFYFLGAGVNDNGIERGLEALATEVERVRRYGFTETELEREKAKMLSSMEVMYNERDKTESSGYASEYIRHFTDDEPLPGIEAEYGMYKRFIPGISIVEINRLVTQLITKDNRIILIDGPEKKGVTIPDEAGIAAILDSVEEAQVFAYIDEVSSDPLVEEPPKPSSVVEERHIDEIGVTEWTLGNGVHVVLKPTDFKNDEILFDSYSPGGNSLVPDEEFIPAMTATSVVAQSGLGPFDLTELQKKLAGKNVAVSPVIEDLYEGLKGSSTPVDLETMFQLIYLYFTGAKADEDAYQSFYTRMKGNIENRNARPEIAFIDTLTVTLFNYHDRARPWTMERLSEMDREKSYRIFQDRFADAGDFTFFFVGNFDLAAIKPFVEQYLGGLPSTGREEQWRDVGLNTPKGFIEKTVRKGLEPKSRAMMIFNGPFDFVREERYLLKSMTDLLDIKLRETLREELGGTYSVSVSPSVNKYPESDYAIYINFGASPDRVDELTEVVLAQIDSMKTELVDKSYINKITETQRREREVNTKENSFWLSIMTQFYRNGEDPRLINDYESFVEGLTREKIRDTARRYFDMNNYIKVVLLPEI